MQRDDFRDDLPVSRGQWRALACLMLALTPGVSIPKSRYQATELIARLRKTSADQSQRPTNGDNLPF